MPSHSNRTQIDGPNSYFSLANKGDRFARRHNY